MDAVVAGKPADTARFDEVNAQVQEATSAVRLVLTPEQTAGGREVKERDQQLGANTSCAFFGPASALRAETHNSVNSKPTNLRVCVCVCARARNSGLHIMFSVRLETSSVLAAGGQQRSRCMPNTTYLGELLGVSCFFRNPPCGNARAKDRPNSEGGGGGRPEDENAGTVRVVLSNRPCSSEPSPSPAQCAQSLGACAPRGLPRRRAAPRRSRPPCRSSRRSGGRRLPTPAAGAARVALGAAADDAVEGRRAKRAGSSATCAGAARNGGDAPHVCFWGARAEVPSTPAPSLGVPGLGSLSDVDCGGSCMAGPNPTDVPRTMGHSAGRAAGQKLRNCSVARNLRPRALWE